MKTPLLVYNVSMRSVCVEGRECAGLHSTQTIEFDFTDKFLCVICDSLGGKKTCSCFRDTTATHCLEALSVFIQ